jgi:hypothetical protein
MEAALGDTVSDCTTANPELHQLTTSDHAVLPGRQGGQSYVTWAGSCMYFMSNPAQVLHAAHDGDLTRTAGLGALRAAQAVAKTGGVCDAHGRASSSWEATRISRSSRP